MFFPVVSIVSSLSLLSHPVCSVMEDVDYGAITGIHIGKTFDLLPYTGKGASATMVQHNTIKQLKGNWL